MMKREWFIEEDEEPAWSEVESSVIAFDFAGTLPSDVNPYPDYTSAVRMSRLKNGQYFIHEIRRTRIRYGDWQEWILSCWVDRPYNPDIIIPIDPNAAARAASEMLAKSLSEAGLFVRRFNTRGRKVDRARPFISMLSNGGVHILKGCSYDEHNEVFEDNRFFYRECEAFDGENRKGENGKDDRHICRL